jgi:protein-L-isoaspartate(D-aspartate) O-methyltransferase
VEPEPGDATLHRERRRRLIEHLRSLGIRDLAVLHAFDEVPRHRFVPEVFRARAYSDEALPIGHGQTISRPSTHARYLEALKLSGAERVLEVGTGSGFQTALLAELAERVYSIDRVPELARAARDRIEGLGYTNVVVRAGDGTYGWRRYAPFDAILVTAQTREVPTTLLEQLGPDGRLVIPVGESDEQDLHLMVRGEDGGLKDQVIGQVRFVPLQGGHGGGEREEAEGRG